MLTKDGTTCVTLPGGRQVTKADTPQEWWYIHGGSGYVDPALLAPDPKNPRRSLNQARFNELKISVGKSGVKQNLIVTPLKKAPWVELPPEHASKELVIVSGWRRSMAALAEQVLAVPVTIEIYANSKEHRLAASIYNRHRDDPSPLDDAYEIVTLHDDEGWTYEELGGHFGLSPQYVRARIGLTKLCPRLQGMLDEFDRSDKPLKVSVGQELGNLKTPSPQELDELFVQFEETLKAKEYLPSREFDELSEDERRFLLQNMLFSVVEAKAFAATRAIAFIKGRGVRLESHQSSPHVKGSCHFQPSRRKERLLSNINAVCEGEIIDWTHADWHRTFELSSREDVEQILDRAMLALDHMQGIVKKLASIRDGKKRTHPDVVRLVQQPPRQEKGRRTKARSL